MVAIEVEKTRQFTQPIRQIVIMLTISALIGFSGYLARDFLSSIYKANVYLNGFIIGVFGIGVLACFMQVLALISSISWLKRFTNGDGSFAGNPPRLLTSLVSLMKIRQSKMKIGTASSHSIMESVASRIDEAREITRYINNLLIFLGLLGTFYGLATTVPAVVETIRSLNPSENEGGVEVFSRLMSGLEDQLGGMGTAFASSLLGLTGSLIVGVLELFASHGQNRFYRQLEDWLSSITRVSLANTENDGGGQSSNGILDEVLDQMSGQMSIALAQVANAVEKLQSSLDRADKNRSKTDEKMDKLLQTLQTLADASQENSETEILQSSQEYSALTELISGQEKLLERLLIEGDNSEIRMNLKNIDAHFSKAMEEIPSNYRETTIVLREGLDRLIETIEKLDKSTEIKDPFDTERKN